jgi:hypothetical protein
MIRDVNEPSLGEPELSRLGSFISGPGLSLSSRFSQAQS